MKPVLKTSALAILVALGASACLSNKDHAANKPIELNTPKNYNYAAVSAETAGVVTNVTDSDVTSQGTDSYKAFNTAVNTANKTIIEHKDFEMNSISNGALGSFGTYTLKKDPEQKDDKDVTLTYFQVPYGAVYAFESDNKIFIKYAGGQKNKDVDLVKTIDDKSYTFDGVTLAEVTRKGKDGKLTTELNKDGRFTFTVKKEADKAKLVNGVLKGVYGEVKLVDTDFTNNKATIDYKNNFDKKADIKTANAEITLTGNDYLTAVGKNVVEAEADKFIKDDITKVQEGLVGRGREVVEKAAAAK
ncbi:hypothetical protein MZA89_03805 [Haemophilus influenzae]|nr:hypothetical protein [Haemophilus influenzae]